METWENLLEALTPVQLKDLYAFLWESEKNCSSELMKDKLLHGKKRHIFKLIDKDAYKTLRRLYRHPQKDIDITIYPVEQLLTLKFIYMEDTVYKLHPQAFAFIKSIYSSRHLEQTIKEWQEKDELLLGLMHSYGILSITEISKYFTSLGISFPPQEQRRCIQWRLSLRNILQVQEIKKGRVMMQVVILQVCDAATLLKQCIKEGSPQIAISYEEIKVHKDRYYALALPEVKALIVELKTRLSSQFALRFAQEMIDTHQYHSTTFPHSYELILRVFTKEEIDVFIQKVIHSLPSLDK